MSNDPRRRLLWLIGLYLFMAGVIFMVLGLKAPLPDESATVTSREAVILEISDPALALEEPKTVALPYRHEGGLGSWTVLKIPVPPSADSPPVDPPPVDPGGGLTSFYLPAYSGRVVIHMNGHLLVKSTWLQPAHNREAAQPILISLPEPLWHPGTNHFDVILKRVGGTPAFVGPIYFGRDDNLRPIYNDSVFLFSTLPRLLDGWQIGLSLFLFLLWVMRPLDHVYLVFSIILLGNITGSLPSIIVDWSEERYFSLINIIRLWTAWLMIPFASLFVGRRSPAPFPLFMIPPALLTIYFFFSSPDDFFLVVFNIFVPATILSVFVALLILLHSGFRDDNDSAKLFLGALGMGLPPYSSTRQYKGWRAP